jgi:uncharacterized membrane protein
MLRNITYLNREIHKRPGMGFLDFVFKKKKEKTAPERPELKKAMPEKYEQSDGARKMVSLAKMSTEEPKMYSQAFEHPLLTIQDRISKLEETYRSMNDKLGVINAKVATKDDVNELRGMVKDDIATGDKILDRVEGIDSRLSGLRKARDELTRQVDVSAKRLTQHSETLRKVDEEITLLECDQRIIDSLRNGDRSTIELSSQIGLTRQYIWGRLGELAKAGYVKSVKSGRQTKYHLVKGA